MKKIHKITVLLLAVALMLGAFAACTGTPSNTAPPQVTASPDTSPDASPDETASADPDATPDSQATPSASDKDGKTVEVPVQIEGDTENMTFTYKSGSYNYVLAYDAEKFKFEADDDEDEFSVKQDDAADAKFEVSFRANTSVEDCKSEVATEMAREVQNTEYEDTKLNEMDAAHFYGSDDEDSIEYYILKSGDGCLVIRVECALEATEGWGARMFAMINTIELLG